MVSSDRADHSWSFAINTRGGRAGRSVSNMSSGCRVATGAPITICQRLKKLHVVPCSARMHVPCSPRRISQLVSYHGLHSVAYSAVLERLPRRHHRIDVTAARLKPKDSVRAITVSVTVGP